MKLVAAMLPADVAAYLDAVQAQLAGLETCSPEELGERLARARTWLSESAASLRKSDTRGKAEPKQESSMTAGIPSGWGAGGAALREAEVRARAQAKKPCDCEDSPPRKKSLQEHVARRSAEAEEMRRRVPKPEPWVSWRSIGELVARKLVGR